MRKYNSGFTIIEVLVVLIISSTLMTFGVARYREFAVRQEVTVAKRDLISDLRQAQKDAISGRKPQGFTPACNGDLLGFEFDITQTSAPAEYTISYLCDNFGSPTKTIIKTNTLPTNIQLSSTADPVLFRPFTLGVDTNATITISTVGNTAALQYVRIGTNGEIN